MHLPNLFECSLVLATALGACAASEPSPASGTSLDEIARIAPAASIRVQPGHALVVVGATGDGHALYWDGATVWATALRPGAAPVRVVDAAVPPYALTAGPVAMLWTTTSWIDSLYVGAQPGPLVIWTAEHGAHVASSSSWAPAPYTIGAGAAISADGRHVIYSSNVSADGTTGDIVEATPDLGEVTTLASGVAVSPYNACAPDVGFDRDGSELGRRHAHAEPSLDDPGERACEAEPVVAATAQVSCVPGRKDCATKLMMPTTVTGNLLEVHPDLWYQIRTGAGYAVSWSYKGVPASVEFHGPDGTTLVDPPASFAATGSIGTWLIRVNATGSGAARYGKFTLKLAVTKTHK